MSKIKQHSALIFYAFAMVLLLLLLRWVEYRFLIVHFQFEIYIGLIAVFFLLFGIWLANKVTQPKTTKIVVQNKLQLIASDNFILNETELLERKISKRELEVLTLMANGLSNQEIAEQLFVSLNTVKTHIAKLFEKLEVKRRTQAIATAKKLQILPTTLV